MLSQEQAAKYLIVGWIKGWSLNQYFYTVTESQIGKVPTYKLNEMHDLFKWLPSDFNVINKNYKVARYMAVLMPKVVDKIFDEPDNISRLKHWKEILKYDGTKSGLLIGKDLKEARKEGRKGLNAMRAERQYNKMRVEEIRRGSGSHWKVCK